MRPAVHKRRSGGDGGIAGGHAWAGSLFAAIALVLTMPRHEPRAAARRLGPAAGRRALAFRRSPPPKCGRPGFQRGLAAACRPYAVSASASSRRDPIPSLR
jgi:hypothetical protein